MRRIKRILAFTLTAIITICAVYQQALAQLDNLDVNNGSGVLSLDEDPAQSSEGMLSLDNDPEQADKTLQKTDDSDDFIEEFDDNLQALDSVLIAQEESQEGETKDGSIKGIFSAENGLDTDYGVDNKCLPSSQNAVTSNFVAIPSSFSVQIQGYGSTGKFLVPIEPPAEGSIAISTREQLESINNGNYHLTADIDLSGKEWVPIGSKNNAFKGVFDGQGFTISNLTITEDPNEAYVYRGLFGVASSSATIKNLAFEDANINIIVDTAKIGSSQRYFYVGGICGYGGTIKNCYSAGSVAISTNEESFFSHNSYFNVGGISGYKGIVNNCYNTANVTSSFSSRNSGLTSHDVGGICGSSGIINNSYNSGSINAPISVTGSAFVHATGIGGSGSVSVIKECYNIGDVSVSIIAQKIASASANGIGGTTINDCYNMGSVNANITNTVINYPSSYSRAAGISSGPYPITINNCYNIGNVRAVSNYADASEEDEISLHPDTIADNSYCLGNSIHGIQLTTEQMKNSVNFVGFDFENVWGIDSSVNDGYLYLRGLGDNGTNIPDETRDFSISKIEPNNGAENISCNTDITITFNANISTYTSDSIALMRYDNDKKVETLVNDVLFDSDNRQVVMPHSELKTIVLSPVEPLEENMKYYISIIPASISGYVPEGFNKYIQGISKKDNYFFITGSNIPSETLTVSFLAQAPSENKRIRTYSTKWNMDYFDQRSTVPNIELARASMALSAAAYGIEEAKYRTDYAVRKALIGAEGIGFNHTDEAIKSINFDRTYSANSDRVGAFIARREVVYSGNNYSLVAIVIRGTTEGEWYSNFNMSDSDPYSGNVHEGFHIAAEEIEKELAKYLETLPDNKNVKLWITGHSRGAAVANIIANSFSNGKYSAKSYSYSNNVQFSKEDVFAYTFATPSVAKINSQNEKSSNIHNFINMEDFVAMVPLKEWLFNKYGNTYIFPSVITHANGYGDDIETMTEYFLNLTDNKFVSYGGGYPSARKFAQYIYDEAPSIPQIYEKQLFRVSTLRALFKDLADFLASGFSSQLGGNLLEIVGHWGDSPGRAELINFMVINQKNMFHSHAVETYISWIETLDMASLKSMQSVLKLDYKCPVDIRVYNSNGTLVGEVANNVVNTNIANSVQIIVEGDDKTLYLCGENDYKIEIAATDSGTMDCAISEIFLSDGIQRRINFYNISLETGKTFTTTVNAGDIVDIPADLYALKTGSGDTVAPDEVLVGANVENVIIALTATSGGTAMGNQILTKGDRARISAIPADGYIFIGWYKNGNLEIADLDYSFIATTNRTLEARFSPASTSNTSYTITATAGTGGTVSGGGSYAANANVSLTATPQPGYTFDGWYENNIKISSTNAFAFTATANRSLYASFRRLDYAVAPSSSTTIPSIGRRSSYSIDRGVDTDNRETTTAFVGTTPLFASKSKGLWDGSGAITFTVPDPSSPATFSRAEIWKTGSSSGRRQIDRTSMSIKSGSTIITLNESYLASLDDGQYTIRFEFWNYHAETVFEVDRSNPQGSEGPPPPIPDVIGIDNENYNPGTGR